jgi:hypothetical protein
MSAGRDLLLELEEAGRRVRNQHLRHINALGVSFSTIADEGLKAVPIGISCGRITADGLFEPGDGSSFIVQPVLADGAPVDIVAWRSMRPDRWGLRLGIGWALGSDNISRSFDRREPLRLSSTPLEWLRQGGDGACVLDWTSPELRTLIDCEEIETDSDILAGVLLRELSKPIRMPKIIRRKAARHAA